MFNSYNWKYESISLWDAAVIDDFWKEKLQLAVEEEKFYWNFHDPQVENFGKSTVKISRNELDQTY